MKIIRTFKGNGCEIIVKLSGTAKKCLVSINRFISVYLVEIFLFMRIKI